jgi:hypothetical protein
MKHLSTPKQQLNSPSSQIHFYLKIPTILLNLIEITNLSNNLYFINMESRECFYCKKQTNNENEYYYNRLIYKIHSSSHFPPSTVKYSHVNIYVPRCKSCFKKHDNFGFYFKALAVWGASILVTILYAVNRWEPEDIFGVILIALMFGGITGIVLSKILYALDRLFFKMFAGIPSEDDVSQYPLIRKILNHRWYKHIPNAHEVYEGHVSNELSEEVKMEIKKNNQFLGPWIVVNGKITRKTISRKRNVKKGSLESKKN